MKNIFGEMPTSALVQSQTNQQEIPKPTRNALDDILETPEGISAYGEPLSVLDPLAPAEKLRTMSNDAIFNLLCRHLGKDSTSLENPAQEQKFLNELQVDIINANAFLRDTLQVPQKLYFDEATLPRITSRTDLIALIKSTTRYNAGGNTGNNAALLRHMKNCALIKTVIGVHHLRQRESEELKKDAQVFDNDLCHGENTLFVDDPMDSGTGCRAKLLPLDHATIPATFCSRGKSPESLLMKYLGKVENNAAEALKDGVAVRIEADAQNISDILNKVAYHIADTGATNIKIKMSGAMLSDDDFTAVKKSLADVRDHYGQSIDFPERNNPITSKRYSDIKILATVRINGHQRSIECQITKTANKNESGMSNHNVYDFAKKVRIFTRLFGRCPQSWISTLLRDIEERTGLKAENVLQSLTDEGVIAKAPGNRGYIDVSTYERWCALDGLVPDAYCRYIIQKKIYYLTLLLAGIGSSPDEPHG